MTSQSTDTAVKDVAIIGAGPVGLFAIFECGMLGLSTHVIDALPEIGGQCTALYPEKPIYDIPAYPEIMAEDLIEKLEAQAKPFNPTYHLNQQVTALTKDEDTWLLETSIGNTIKAKTIIIAGGGGSFGPNRPPLENIEEYEGTSIFYMVQKKTDFADKDVVIAGGGDSAVDWAISLSDIAKSITVVHRRDKFRAAPTSVTQLQDLAERGKINLCTPYQLSRLAGDSSQLDAVIVKGKDGEEKSIKANILLPFYGLAMDLGPINDWNLDLQKSQIQVDPTTCQTSAQGIYAIGDIATYDNKLKLILTGFSEAAFAAHAIYKVIHPDTPLHFEYSTTKGMPQ